MATSKSPLSGGSSKPSVPKQGSHVGAPKQSPRVSAGKPGGHLAGVSGLPQPKRSGKRPAPKSGSGTGARKGNSLPR